MSTASASGIVSWSDTDASGRFHFTAPWRWVEDAEHALYRRALPSVAVGCFPRRTASATYEQPLQAGDSYSVELTVDRIGHSSISYTWQVLGPAGVAVRGHHTVVHVNSDGQAAAIEPSVRAALSPEGYPAEMAMADNAPEGHG